MRLLSLGLGGVLADHSGIAAIYVAGGVLLALAGALGLVLLGYLSLDRSLPNSAVPAYADISSEGLIKDGAQGIDVYRCLVLH